MYPPHTRNLPSKFEVSTVKRRASGSRYHFYDCAGDRFMFSGPALGNLLQWTYAMRSIEVYLRFIRSVSIPMEFYEIQANAPGPIESLSQCRLMVQALLADRFKLSVHGKSGRSFRPGGGARPKLQEASLRTKGPMSGSWLTELCLR
jgi:uncharacterized protein (TIGR03435 family)